MLLTIDVIHSYFRLHYGVHVYAYKQLTPKKSTRINVNNDSR